MLKQVVVLLLSGVSRGHPLTLAEESWAVSDLIWLVAGMWACREPPASLQQFGGCSLALFA